MARPDGNQTWGTWEELLLACAVHRHGTHSWDSVAAELQKRTSSLRLATPLACQNKFRELQRRFSKCGAVLDSAVPWLEELRKLRVTELRRDVERYDLSIVSLQLKVRRLTEEREQINHKVTENSDLEKKGDYGGEDEGKQPVAGEESDKENRSINESNSTDPKDDSGRNRPEKAVESVRSEEETKRGGEDKGAAEDSCDGSCYSVAEESAEKSERVEEGRESGESMAESKGEGSDTQSSASPSKQEDGSDQSGCQKRVSLQSQPLVDFLEKLRSHKQVCVFERRLKSQEMPYYGNLIRQHLDLATLGTRLEEGCYSDCSTKFFRDLLLLVNNALVFFGPKSKEYSAAFELRKLVSEAVALQAQAAQPAAPELLPPKPDSEPSHLLTINTKLSVPSIACRKRSSLAGKASRTSAPDKKTLQQPGPGMVDEKPIIDLKQQDQSIGHIDESREVEVRDEKSNPAAPRKTKKDTKSRPNPVKNENLDKPIGGSSDGDSVPKGKKEENKVTNSKKRNAANFLNRIKRGSPPNKVLVNEETLEYSVDAPVEAKTVEKGNRDVENDLQKEGNLRTRAGGRREKEQGNGGKRKQRSVSEAPQPRVVVGKRHRGGSEGEAGSFGQTTKRSRK